MDNLTESNLLLYAAKHYYNPRFSDIDEFYEDLKRFKYIKRLLRRYIKTHDLKTQLLLNHIIIIYNIFGDAGTPLLFYKLEKEYWSSLKSILIFLNRIDENSFPSIEVDNFCLEELKKI